MSEIISSIREKEIDSNSFIGGWYIDKEICEELIEYFKYNKKYTTSGKTGSGLDIEAKDSTDLIISAGNFDGIVGKYRKVLQSLLKQYFKKFPESEQVYYFKIREQINLQYYKSNGGFKKWHHENEGNPKSIQRHLVFMTYLNEVKNGGTDFKYYKDVVNDAEQGLTLIWPAGWTHNHKGRISEDKEKYIITGWYNFQKE
jgi:hypothetical protein